MFQDRCTSQKHPSKHQNSVPVKAYIETFPYYTDADADIRLYDCFASRIKMKRIVRFHRGRQLTQWFRPNAQ